MAALSAEDPVVVGNPVAVAADAKAITVTEEAPPAAGAAADDDESPSSKRQRQDGGGGGGGPDWAALRSLAARVDALQAQAADIARDLATILAGAGQQ